MNDIPMYRSAAAELFGTLVLASIAATAGSLQSGALFVGLSLAALVYLLAPVSGAQFNPAITLGLAAFRHISPVRALVHVLSQLVGAALGVLLVGQITGQLIRLTNITEVENPVIIAELTGATLLAFAVATVARGKVAEGFGGLVIGLALMAGILLASPTGFGILNPAVSAGLAIAAWPLYVMPILGGVLGVALSHLIHGDMPMMKKKA